MAKSLIKEGFTDEKDAHDAFLLGFGVGLIGIVVLTAAGIYQGHAPTVVEFAQSIGWLTSGSGVGYGLKRAGEKYDPNNYKLPAP